jgi:hypothetical protein
MNMTIFKNMKAIVLGLLVSSSLAVMTGCEDEVDKSNRFTFTGELIADHLQNNPEFSDFCFILDKAKIGKKSSSSILKTLSTYGSYTCFAPTNDAMRAYIEKLYNDRALCAQMGQNARNLACSRFSREAGTAAKIELYEKYARKAK